MKAFVGSLLLATGICTIGWSADPVDTPPIKVARSNDTTQAPFKPLTAEQTDTSSNTVAVQPTKLDPKPTKPNVLFSKAHRDTCVKFINDTIDPNTTVTDINGSDHKLVSLLSDRLTVLIFWQEESVLGLEQFRRIPVDILATFASHRVKVIAANVGGDVASTKRITGDGADKIDSLVDRQGALFQQFAKSEVPRTYVLDKDGKILWMDLEYSQSTRRSLANALTYYLKTQPAKK